MCIYTHANVKPVPGIYNMIFMSDSHALMKVTKNLSLRYVYQLSSTFFNAYIRIGMNTDFIENFYVTTRVFRIIINHSAMTKLIRHYI